MIFLWSFLIGGALCAVGEILILKTKLTPARILVGYVFVGILLSAVGIYEPFVRLAGAGAFVPLTGFGHSLAQGAKEAVDEMGALGIITGGLRACATGITAAILFGFFTGVLFRGKPDGKRKTKGKK